MLYKYPVCVRVGVALLFLLSCSATRQTTQMNENKAVVTEAVPADSTRTDKLPEAILQQYPQLFNAVLANRKDWNVQILYTQVNRGPNGIPELKTHHFNTNPARYFYPASTIKLPIVLLALQKLNELKDRGIDRNSTMITETDFAGQMAVYNDATTPDGRPTIAHYIKKILLVSDNDAFNRLYEFLGQDYINAELHKKGYRDVQVLHRLNIFLSDTENRHTNPVQFLGKNNELLYRQDGQFNKSTYLKRNDSLGKGYYKGGVLKNGPMDFSAKNRISLEDLHNIIISVIFPDKVPASQRFNITEDDRRFVLQYLSEWPTESRFPPYSADTATYPPAYSKFLLMGGGKGPAPQNIRLFSKSGDAYGHMLDIAYIVDFKNKTEFFLSAVIYCNSDGILNDDRYDYDSIGYPFMKNLGQVIYDYELKREKKIQPDLSSFMFNYDK